MTDHELLELAAKASGILFRTDPMGQYRDCSASHDPAQNIFAFPLWNPLTDDGDALRLAVKVLNWPHGGRAFGDAVSAMFAVGQLPQDPCAATRRAIVRAAAEIGRTR